MSIDAARRLFLLAMSLGLLPVALSYVAAPLQSLPRLYGVGDPDVATRHVFRAVMGLYLGMIAFWLAGALRRDLQSPALWGVFVFVTGVVSGRVLSLALDGRPPALLLMYLIAEVILSGLVLYLVALAPDRRNRRAPQGR